MKFIIVLCILFAVITIQSLNAARVCVIQANTCKSNVTVCGRYGRSNLCTKFKNNCDLQSANCSDSIGYTAVNSSRCTGIALNQRKLCRGVSGLTGTTSTILSNLLSGYNTNNVQPIVINTGK